MKQKLIPGLSTSKIATISKGSWSLFPKRKDMANTYGLVGLRPAPQHVADFTSPPYDVAQMGVAMERLLSENPRSLYHLILALEPAQVLERMTQEGWLIPDEEPCYYVYEQSWGHQSRLGVLFAGEVSDYSQRQIIRHEKTFPGKVEKSILLKRQIRHDIGPVFLFTRAMITGVLRNCTSEAPLYAFTSRDGIRNRVWRVPESSGRGKAIQEALRTRPFYIADGHHRYQAALSGGLERFVAYATEHAHIEAYNRVIRGSISFDQIRAHLPLESVSTLVTPPKNAFCLYSAGRSYLLRNPHKIERDLGIVERLDCSVLEREFYPIIGLKPHMMKNPENLGYYPENAMAEMKLAVDRGDYDVAVALHPVSLDELIAVADAGLDNPGLVMPEKSTFFAPKVLSGLFLQRID